MSEIPFIDFGNTGEGTYSKISGRLRATSKILKTLGFLEMCLDMGSIIKVKCYIAPQVP